MNILAKGLRLRHLVLVHTRTKGSKDIKRLVKFNFIHENASFNHHNNEHCIAYQGSGEGLKYVKTRAAPRGVIKRVQESFKMLLIGGL